MQLLSLPEVAEFLGIPINRVHQMVRDGQLVAVRGEDGSLVGQISASDIVRALARAAPSAP